MYSQTNRPEPASHARVQECPKSQWRNLLGTRAATENEAPAEYSPLYVARMLKKMTPAERVREAIRGGARTQKQIAHETKLAKDEIGDALANLLLWTHEIRTKMVNNTRLYFINEVEVERPYLTGYAITAVLHLAPAGSSFSSLKVLMPGTSPPRMFPGGAVGSQPRFKANVYGGLSPPVERARRRAVASL